MSSELKKLQKEERRRRQAGIRFLDRASAPKIPTSVLAPTNFSLSNEQEKDEGVDISGLADICFCTSPETLVYVLGSMVGDTLKYPSNDK